MNLNEPSQDQIKGFIEHIKSVSMFYALHQGEEPSDPDLVVVMEWLEAKARG